MRALPGYLCHYWPGETIGEPGRQWIAPEAVTISTVDEFRDSIAEYRPVSHSFSRSKTSIVRFSEAGNNGPTFGHMGHGF